MKQVFVVLAIVLLACGWASAGPVQSQATPKARAEQAPGGGTFAGTIAAGHMKGGIANPHLVVEVKGEDGKTVSFNVTKETAVTDVDGKALNYMRDFRKGKKVEIKYSVNKGQNDATSMHYLE